MLINNDGDASMVAGVNRLLEEDEREALEAERLRAAAIPPNTDDAFANLLQGRDVRFELPPGMRRAGAAAAADRAPSNGSVISVGSVAVFGRANPRTLEEIAVNDVLACKDKRGGIFAVTYFINFGSKGTVAEVTKRRCHLQRMRYERVKLALVYDKLRSNLLSSELRGRSEFKFIHQDKGVILSTTICHHQQSSTSAAMIA
jgi:hypothetical protein